MDLRESEVVESASTYDLWTSARWRGRVAAQAVAWRREQATLLAELHSLQDDATRARMHAVETTRVTAGWSDGYKQGCSDMIKVMAALHGEIVTGPQHHERA